MARRGGRGKLYCELEGCTFGNWDEGNMEKHERTEHVQCKCGVWKTNIERHLGQVNRYPTTIEHGRTDNTARAAL